MIKSLEEAKYHNLSKYKKTDSYNELKNNNDKYMLLDLPAQNLDKKFNKNCIDLIITDPPYVDQIPYSEYMQLYKAFLNTKINFNEEIIISNSKDRSKNEDNYFDLLEKSFSKLSSFLKSGKYMCVFFHDSNLSYWVKIITIANNNNLEYISQVHVGRNKKTIKNISDPKRSLDGDCIVFFKKKNKNIVNQKSNLELKEIKKEIVNISFEIINKNEGSTTARLYDEGLMSFLIKNNALKVLNKNNIDLVNLLEENFKFKDGKWITEKI